MTEPGQLRIYDDMHRMARVFEPLTPGRVNMYVCGVTVYGPCHIGHARAYISFDVIRRYLEFKGYAVNYIQNFTDIDDKIIKKANEENVSISVISERYINEYFRDMDALNVTRATAYPRATGYIDKMIAMTDVLIAKGFAYESDGNVFFDVARFEPYGKLSNRNLADEQVIQEPAPGKNNPADFALWKKAQAGEPGWDSPWGRGRPGWHIECSAMALELAGGTLDIHGGGEDLTFPHHENEIAQSEAATGKPFVRYWMHNGFVNVDKEKMSKSIGNVLNVGDVLKKHSPEALRVLFLSAHYRAPVQFSEDRLIEAGKALDRFRTFHESLERIKCCALDNEPTAQSAQEIDEFNLAVNDARLAFCLAMDEDFNTPAALAQVFTIIRKGNALVRELEISLENGIPHRAVDVVSVAWKAVVELAAVLGLDMQRVLSAGGGGANDVDALMDILIQTRHKARESKAWEISDYIRDALKQAGYAIEDRPQGTSWRKE